MARESYNLSPNLVGGKIETTIDNSGGVASDTIGVITPEGTANAIATLNAKQEAILVALRKAGIISV